MSTSTIKRLEADNGVPNSAVPKLNAIQTALKNAVIEFIGTPDDRPVIRIRTQNKNI